MDSLVKDVMTNEVVSVRETAEYKEIVAAMRKLHISALPVLDEEDRLVGVVSEADLLLKEVGQGALGGYLISTGRRGERAKAAGFTAAELMSSPALTIGPDDSVSGAARLMHDRHVKRLPVVDDEGRVVGILSRVDVLSVFARPDGEIRDEVIKNIQGDFAFAPNQINVTVRSGVVTVSGQVESLAVARDLINALKHAEGVVGARSRLSYPPPDPSEGIVHRWPRPPGYRSAFPWATLLRTR